MVIEDRIYVIVSSISGAIVDIIHIESGHHVKQIVCDTIQAYYRYDSCDMEGLKITSALHDNGTAEFIYMPVKQWRETRK